MKKIISITIAALALLAMSSCQREGTVYEIPDGSPCISFPSSDAIFKDLVASDGDRITVELWRGTTAGALSVPVQITDGTDGLFKPAKQSFDFAAGEAVATLDFVYDINELGGDNYSITLEVDPEQVSPAGIDKMTVSASRKLTRVFLGTGLYYSDWYEEEWPQDIYTTAEAPNLYILPDCWVRGTDFTFTMVDGVPTWPNPFFSGYVHSSYGNVMIYPGSSYIEDGTVVLEVSGYRVSAGSFGGGIEAFTLPEGLVL